jgi:TonB family protein
MYYQADLEHSNRLFKLFLVLSIVVHAGILFYKKNRNTFLLASDSPFPVEQSIRVRLQEMAKPEPKVVPRKVTKKKIIKKKVTKAKPKSVKKTLTKTVQNSQPQKKAFESVIRDYVAPHYPRLALRRGITGKVRLTLWVKGNGKLDKVLIAQSSGHQSLDQSALDAAKRWTFKDLSKEENQLFKLSKLVVYKIN